MHLETIVAAILASCSAVKIRSINTPCVSDILDNCTIFNHSVIVYVGH